MKPDWNRFSTSRVTEDRGLHSGNALAVSILLDKIIFIIYYYSSFQAAPLIFKKCLQLTV